MALVILILTACGGNPVAKKTNVLSRPPSTKNATGKNNTTKPAPNAPPQTVFKRPEQNTRNTKDDEQEPDVVKRPQREYAQENNTSADSGTDLSELVYRSPEYYRHLNDSIQFYAKPTYEKTIDAIINQISQNPSQKKNPAVNSKWYASVNFNIRKPNFVILHHTAQTSADQTLFTFSISRTQTSAHYVVSRDGTVYQMLNDYVRSWHAGASKWGNITDMNSCSLGIEIDNNGKTEAYTDAQIKALIKLLDYLKNEYAIPTSNFIAHSDIAPGRKEDPSKYFPWKTLADAGFGYWYNPNNLKDPPPDFNALLALRVIGYNIQDPGKAIGAFKLHYIQNDNSRTLTDYDKRVLYNIYLKY